MMYINDHISDSETEI